MPCKLTPEYRRAYRARLIAEGRCANCGRVRAENDRDTLTCHACRVTKNRGSARRYADQREANPPAFDRNDPRESFRYGKTRLKNPRRITVRLDRETLDCIDRLRVHWKRTPDYEPYLVSEFVRRMLATLQDYDGPIPYRLGAMDRRDSSGLSLCFMCDEDNGAVLQRQRDRTGCTLPNAVRDCLTFAALRLFHKIPDAEARRLIWPTRFDIIPGEKGKRIPPCPPALEWTPPRTRTLGWTTGKKIIVTFARCVFWMVVSSRA